MSKLDSLALAIATQEGFISSSGELKTGNTIPIRLNNPGDLRASSFATGNSNGYSVFPTVADGWRGLYRQIGLDVSRGLTLAQFVAKYAPVNDNNNTSAYLAAVSRATGIPPTARLSDYIPPFDPESPVIPTSLPGYGSGPTVLSASEKKNGATQTNSPDGSGEWGFSDLLRSSGETYALGQSFPYVEAGIGLAMVGLMWALL